MFVPLPFGDIPGAGERKGRDSLLPCSKNTSKSSSLVLWMETVSVLRVPQDESFKAKLWTLRYLSPPVFICVATAARVGL